MITAQDLKLAALAAGKNVAVLPFGRDQFQGLDVDTRAIWRPHTDIADAARLAVRLGMNISVGDQSVLVQPRLAQVDELIEHDSTDADAERAYCEAVTLCAAQIGRRMRENGQ